MGGGGRWQRRTVHVSLFFASAFFPNKFFGRANTRLPESARRPCVVISEKSAGVLLNYRKYPQSLSE